MTPTIEERVAYLEGKGEEQSNLTFELREMVTHLDQKADRFWGELSIRIDSLDQRLSTRIDSLDQKVDRFREELSIRINSLDQRLSTRIDSLDQKVDRFREELSVRIDSLDKRLSTRIESLDQKFSRYFLWLIGIQVTILISIIATLLRS